VSAERPDAARPVTDHASFARVIDELSARDCRPRVRGDHADARCPAHEDRSPSLSVDWRDDPVKGGVVLVRCHAGCDFADVLAAAELVPADLYDTPPARPAARSAKLPARQNVKPRERGSAQTRERKDVSAHAGGDLGRVVARYTYTDAAGAVVGRVLRYEPKTFRPQRPAGRGWKFGAPAGGFPLYRLPEVAATVAAGGVVFVVEGEKDADAIAAAGATATTHAGGADTAGGGSKWRDEHTAALAGARVVLVADRDGPDPKHPDRGYPGYRHAITVRDALAAAGTTVTVVEAVEGKDAADHLAAGRTLDELAGNVITPEHRVPPAVLDTWRATAPVLGGPERFRRDGGGGDGPAGGDELVTVQRDVYRAIGDSLVKMPTPGGRARQPVEVLDCRARILRRVRTDLGDGDRPTVTHVDLVAERDGQAVELPGVEWADFVSGEWAKELPWSASFKRTHGGKSDVVNAVQQCSGVTPVVDEYGVLGWRELPDGRCVFIHAGGAIGAAGVVDVRVNVPPQLGMYVLPAPSTSDADRAAYALITLSLLDRLPARIAAPLLGAAFRPLLGRTTSTVMLIGSPGTGKTSLASIALQHHAPAARYDRVPIGAGEDAATVTAMEEWRYRAGNLLFLADDLAPDRGHERAAQRANLLARSQYNTVGKGRGRREGGTRPSHPPRGLLMLTGEDGGSNESAETRIVYVRVARGDVDIRTLAALGETSQAEARAQCAADVIRWCAERVPLDEWARKARVELTDELYDPDTTDPIESRRAESAADLAVGIWALITAAQEWGALSADDARDYWTRAVEGLREAKRQQATVTAGRSLPERSAELLRSAVLTGRVHIASRAGGGCPELDPEAARRWGWQDAPGTGHGQVPELRPSGACAGFTDGATLWLDPGAAFAAMQSESAAEREPLTVTRRALGAAFADAGLSTVERAKDGIRHEVRASLLGVQRRVWELPVSWLYDLAEDDGTAPAGDDGPAPTPILPPPTPPAPSVVQVDDVGVQPAQGAPERYGSVTGPDAAESREPAPAPTTAPAASSAPQRAVQRSPYRAPLVVCTADGGVLPDGTVVPLPAELGDLAALLRWAESLELGTSHRRARHDAGQVWVLPDLAAQLDLPESCPKDGRSKAGRQVRAAVEAAERAGWKVGARGLGDWTNVYRAAGGRSLQLVLPGWFGSRDRCLMYSAELAADRLAARLGRFATEVGMPYLITPGVTGVALLRATRAGLEVQVTEPTTPPKPAERGGTELAYAWQRRPTPEEQAMPYVHEYDLNAQYLAATSSVRLGIGSAEHVKAPPFDPNIAGYWLVDPGARPDRLLPDLFDPIARGDRGPRWVTTPTLAVARELGYELAPIEAWLWPESARYFEPWYKLLRPARARLVAARDAGDVEAGAVLESVKRIYTDAIGRLNKTSERGNPLFRPDWYHSIVATARANLTRKLYAVAERTGRRPLAIYADAVLYASDSANPETACPAGLRYDAAGIELGQVKPAGTAPLAELLPLLTGEHMHARTELLTVVKNKAVR
jgi:hypothetical protein